MARFSSTIYACIVIAAAGTAVEAQATRPSLPVQRSGASQVVQSNPQATTQQQPMNQTSRPATPGPNAPQQGGQQQQTARPADPPPTTAPSPPVVTYRDGLLSVQAMNSTMSSVLTAIRNKTGIEFEGWENTNDRVAISQGPAPAGEVLSRIFEGSKFDFVAVGRPDSPGIVQRVILTAKRAPGAPPMAQQQQQNPGQQGGDDEDTPDEQVNSGDPQDTPAQPPAPPQAQELPPNQTQSQPKTPEQLLQELQDMRKQQGQQDPNANPNQVPKKQPPQ